MACYHKMFDSDLLLFRQKFQDILMKNMELTKETVHVQSIGNLPFQFGEMSGNYIDYLDKLISFLQSLLCHLLYRYPKVQKLGELSRMLISFRAYHWAASLKSGVTSERVTMTLSFVSFFFSADWILELHEILGKLELQNGVTAWNTFMFLYEMLGVSSMILPLLNIDINTCDEESIQRVSQHQLFTRTIKNEEYKVFVNPQLLQVMEFREQIHTLEITDAEFNLKPFCEIYEHFASSECNMKAKPQDLPKLHLYSCELCLTDVDPDLCQYVFNSMWFFDSALTGGMNRDKMTWEEQRKACASQFDEERAYITFSIGSGLRVICNKGDCKDIFVDHVAVYRIQIFHSITSMLSKYKLQFKDLKCWSCKLLSGNSHRCSTCKSRLYCSKECQNKDWNLHKSLCDDLKEDGKQIKIDSHEQKARGGDRALETFAATLKGCKCGEKDCAMVHDMRRLYGKMQIQETKVEDEVD